MYERIFAYNWWVINSWWFLKVLVQKLNPDHHMGSVNSEHVPHRPIQWHLLAPATGRAVKSPKKVVNAVVRMRRDQPPELGTMSEIPSVHHCPAPSVENSRRTVGFLEDDNWEISGGFRRTLRERIYKKSRNGEVRRKFYWNFIFKERKKKEDLGENARGVWEGGLHARSPCWFRSVSGGRHLRRSFWRTHTHSLASAAQKFAALQRIDARFARRFFKHWICLVGYFNNTSNKQTSSNMMQPFTQTCWKSHDRFFGHNRYLWMSWYGFTACLFTDLVTSGLSDKWPTHL